MGADGDIDLSRYSDAVLQMALKRIDRERHPQNYARMAAELARRRGVAGDETPPGATPAAPDPAAAAPPVDKAPHATVDAPSGLGAAAATASPDDVVRHRPVFTAQAGEYFRIWIVNLALTVVTLGIYSAWAKVRKLRYFYGSTSLAGSAFAYHGEPLKILKGRAIAAALLGAYFLAGQFSPLAGLAALVVLGLAMPWLVVKSRTFAMRMTSWRGMRFDFAADFAGAYKVLLGAGALAILSFGLLLPRFVRERYRFVVSRTRFGQTAFGCEPGTWRFYKTSLVAAGLVFATAAGLALVLGGIVAMLGLEGDPARARNLGSLVGFLIYIPLISVFYGYTQARNLNETFNTTTIGPHRLVSTLSARRMIGLYLGNTLAILLTLGLAIPWAQVRLTRYRLESVELEAHGSLDAFVATATPGGVAATGEEISGFFDVDFGL